MADPSFPCNLLAQVLNDPGGADLYTNNMDFHPFGAWLANEAARVARDTHANKKQRHAGVMELVGAIHKFKVSNGEEIHGFLWQSTRLLAYETGTLDGRRIADPEAAPAIEHVMKVCKPTWWLAAQTRDDCSHAAGHGFFYYFLDVGRAVSACWSDTIMRHTPTGEWDPSKQWYEQMAKEPTALNLLQWRWLCATGVYHAAGNTLSLEVMEQLTRLPNGGSPHAIEEFLCKHANTWGQESRCDPHSRLLSHSSLTMTLFFSCSWPRIQLL